MMCQVKSAEPARELAFSTIQRDRGLVRWRNCLEPAGDGAGLIASFQVIWLPRTARLAEDVLTRDPDMRRQDAMRATLNRIKDLVENGAAPANRPGGAAAQQGRTRLIDPEAPGPRRP